MVKLRSIPPRTHLSLAREKKGISLAQINHAAYTVKKIEPLITGRRGKMRPQISRKPFEEKLAAIERDFSELSQFAAEGLDVSKLKEELKVQIERLTQFLGIAK